MAVANLLLTCVLMFVGPLVAGTLPLAVDLPKESAAVQLMEAFGAGVMIGSAFAVVLPEGFEALCSHKEAHSDESDHQHDHYRRLLQEEDDTINSHALEHEHEHEQEHSHGFPSWAPGLALLSGFIVMMVFEFLHHKYEHVDHEHGSTKVRDQLFECGRGPGHRHSHAAIGSCGQRKELPVLVGLLVHAAADGLAVGVAHVSPSMNLAVAVGAAMVLHKGPVALGLGTYLVSQKCSTLTVVQDIFLFSSASPVVAVFTFAALAQSAYFKSSLFVALSVLFSAGTFLYAACVHMLPSVAEKNFTLPHMGAVIAGALLPCGINFLDLHHH